ncbi:putative Ig domain-containing protein, partial [Candidatus Entotheonella palauensis]|uniref:putative Ig domain-containing protein n=1 Tax=Candidatus Entotheonella palauensis TaxID=93172 RepID=UPI000B7C9A3F
EGPYGGQNPPPNNGNVFDPPQRAGNAAPPPVSMIVRKDDLGRWVDDNNGDWSLFVSGALASLTRRTANWDLPDRDVAIIDTQTLSVQYESRLMNLLMAMAVNPATDEVTVVGTEALNEVRFEPVVNGVFLRVNLARLTVGNSPVITDLNPHLDYQTRNLPFQQRAQSIGDPRGIVWNANGTRAWITGMGSNNVIVINAQGTRQATIPVGAGPTGIVLHESSDRAFVLNKFSGAISVLRLSQSNVIATVPFLDPTPAAVKNGRAFLYNTHLTSGLGHISCASCHVDARTDRLAWDLGNPDGNMQQTIDGRVLHPMKGPMRTQSLQDIIGHPAMHWRGDRGDLSDFNVAFVSLMSADGPISADQMIAFEDFLDTIHFPPNPFRNLDNTLPTSLTLPSGQVINAAASRSAINGCLGCHTDNQTRASTTDSELSQAFIPPAFHGFYDFLGYFQERQSGSTSGFGFFHDGADPLLTAARTPAALASFLTFDGPDNGLNAAQRRQDTHAAVGRQLTVNGAITNAQNTLLTQLIQIANSSNHVELIAKARINGVQRGFFLQSANTFQSDRASDTQTRAQLLDIALAGEPVTFTAVPNGTSLRLGVDLDFDGIFDGDAGPIVVNPGDQTSTENVATTLIINANDPQGTPLSFAASGLPNGLTMNASTGEITGIPSTQGLFNVTVTVTNGNGLAASTSFTWTIQLAPICFGQLATIVGTSGSDELVGTSGDDVIMGLGGNDFIRGRGGNDLICGGAGNDELLGNSGSDQLDGGNDDDVLRGGRGDDALNGGNGNDTCRGDDGSDSATACEITNSIENGGGSNQAPSLANPGDQTGTEGDNVSLTLSASDGDGDPLTFSASGLPNNLGIDSASGDISGVLANGSEGSYNVTVSVSDGTANDSVNFTWTVLPLGNVPTCFGQPATLVGTEGDDILVGTAGVDVIVGLGGNDFIKGRGSNDLLCGGAGNDELLGDSGDDTLNGGSGDDLLRGGNNDDTLNGGSGNDICRGDDGIDTASNCEQTNKIEDGSGNNQAPTLVNPGDQTGNEGDGVSLTLSASDPDGDPLTFSISGLPDNLSIDSASGDISGVLAAGSAGSYTVSATVSDGIDSDSVSFTWTVVDPSDVPTCFGQPATIVGTEGDDTLIGTSGVDVIVGLGGNDFIKGRGSNDLLCGGDGDDELRGDSGEDQLDGGNDDDLLRGGNDDDALIGGNGLDTCRGDSGSDTANDCESTNSIP